MALISLGKINKNLIPIVIGCIFCLFDRLIEKFGEATLSKNEVFTNVCFTISRFLAVIPFIILKRRSKQSNPINDENKSKYKIQFIYTDNMLEVTYDKWKYILISSIIYFFQAIIFMYIFKILTSFWIIYILVTPIFYYMIYKVKLYKHHFVCIILILLIGFIIDFVSGNIKKDINNNLILFLLDFLREIIFSFHNVFVKYLMEKKFVSVYEYSFYNSIINFILIGIFCIFDYNLIKENDYGNYFNSLTTKDILFLLGIIVTQFFVNLSLLFTIKICSPCHVFIMYVFSHFVFMDFNIYLILVIIGLILILFLSLIFNEIIEVNFWGLSDNTKRKIIERARKEDLSIIYNELEDENSENGENNIAEKEDETNN